LIWGEAVSSPRGLEKVIPAARARLTPPHHPEAAILESISDPMDLLFIGINGVEVIKVPV
jgi:hypothetical protein